MHTRSNTSSLEKAANPLCVEPLAGKLVVGNGIFLSLTVQKRHLEKLSFKKTSRQQGLCVGPDCGAYSATLVQRTDVCIAVGAVKRVEFIAKCHQGMTDGHHSSYPTWTTATPSSPASGRRHYCHFNVHRMPPPVLCSVLTADPASHNSSERHTLAAGQAPHHLQSRNSDASSSSSSLSSVLG